MNLIRKNSCDGKYTSLDVRFTKKCDNDCSFCIEKAGLDSLGKTNVNKLIKSTIDSEIKDVLILGGEPFLYVDDLLKYVNGIRKYVDDIYITTALPNTFIKNKETINKIINLIDGLNISIQSTDWEENNKILVASSNHNRLNILKDLNKLYSDKIRTSINLVKNGIDTKRKLIKTLKDLEKYGCKYIKINELQSDPSYISFEKIMNKKYLSPYAFGCNKHIKIKNINSKLLLKRSCFLVEDKNNASIADVIKIVFKKYIYDKYFPSKNIFKVLYENGELKNKWMKNE